MTKSKRTKRGNASIVGAEGKKLSTEEQFRLEYAYVLRDLRTVFILSGAMFLLLIVLNLLLQV